MDASLGGFVKQSFLEIDGRRVCVWYQKVAGVLWAHWEGKTFTFEPTPANKRRSSRTRDGCDGALVAPMPGKTIKVLCQVGQEVEPGQVLVVMEAMKMEYSLEAPCAGLVKTVSCREGDQVALNQVLAFVEAKG